MAAASELRELGRLDEAEALLRKALAIQPQHVGALAELGHVARRRGDRAAALAAFEAAAAADPAHVGMKVSAASELRELGRLDEAEALLRQALVIQPQHVSALAELGHVARRRGDRAAALAAFEAAAAADPAHVGMKVSAASELRELGRLDEAKRCCGRRWRSNRNTSVRWPSLDMSHGGAAIVRRRWRRSRPQQQPIQPASE